MKQILLVPDSFKGTLTSRQVCETMAEQLHLVFPEADITSLPVADGGEGSVDAFLAAAGGERVELPVTGPFGEPVRGFYGLLPDGETAVLEMAACAGLPLAEGRLDPERATTYGVGELILDAIRRGRRKVILGLGGSCTNDGAWALPRLWGPSSPGRTARSSCPPAALAGDCRPGLRPRGQGPGRGGAGGHVRH